MLNRINIYITKPDLKALSSDAAIKIHGFLMKIIPNEYAAELHLESVRPFSLYTIEDGDELMIRLSTLDERAETLIGALGSVDAIRLRGVGGLKVKNVYRYPEISLEELVAGFDFDKVKLSLLTPAIYKANGVSRHTPGLMKYFDAVLRKLKKYENIDVPTPELTRAYNKTVFGRYEFFSVPFMSAGREFYGMGGHAELKLPQDDDGILMKTVLAYATYCGLGGNTAQGMGGISVEKS